MSDDTPEKAKPDWQLAKALWLQRQPYKVICQQCNVSEAALSQRCTREKWVELRAKVSAPAQKLSMAEHGEVVRELMAAETLAQVNNLSTIPNAKNIDTAFVKASILDKLGSAAEKTFGSVDGQRRKVINIGLLQSMKTIDESARLLTPPPAERENVTTIIDVPSTPLPEALPEGVRS